MAEMFDSKGGQNGNREKYGARPAFVYLTRGQYTGSLNAVDRVTSNFKPSRVSRPLITSSYHAGASGEITTRCINEARSTGMTMPAGGSSLDNSRRLMRIARTSASC